MMPERHATKHKAALLSLAVSHFLLEIVGDGSKYLNNLSNSCLLTTYIVVVANLTGDDNLCILFSNGGENIGVDNRFTNIHWK